MVEAIRKLVSGNRRRLYEDNFSLDMTYIIPNRLIAMSYPSSGFESLYRNSIDNVSRKMRTKIDLNVPIHHLTFDFINHELFLCRSLLF